MVTAPAAAHDPHGPAESGRRSRPEHRSSLGAAATAAWAVTSAAAVLVTLVAAPRTDRYFAAHTAASPEAA
jgi:hypothetical protein